VTGPLAGPFPTSLIIVFHSLAFSRFAHGMASHGAELVQLAHRDSGLCQGCAENSELVANE
jgi:hypothetical protein